jgi:DNA-binding NtrC family response regulator
VSGFSAEAERLLLAYSWPGNIRELENAIERAVVLGESDRIEAADLPEHIAGTTPEENSPPQGLTGSLEGARREAIIRAWAQANGDYKEAASILGLHPNSLLRLIRKLGLRQELKGGDQRS